MNPFQFRETFVHNALILNFFGYELSKNETMKEKGKETGSADARKLGERRKRR